MQGASRRGRKGGADRFVATAHQCASRKRQPRDALEAAFVESSCAVREPLAALEGGANGRVGLPLLERFERVEVRVGVVESDDIAACDQRVDCRHPR